MLVHLSILRNFAFMATITVLSDISTAPSAGLRSILKGYRTPAARGIATTLYPVAQARDPAGIKK